MPWTTSNKDKKFKLQLTLTKKIYHSRSMISKNKMCKDPSLNTDNHQTTIKNKDKQKANNQIITFKIFIIKLFFTASIFRIGTFYYIFESFKKFRTKCLVFKVFI